MRATHHRYDRPRILDDPLAIRLIESTEPARVADDPGRRRLRASIALRTRYAEDCLAEAVSDGTRQYVILGAGLDSFAYRNPFASAGLRVFEVDHPETQAWKRSRLGEARIAIPASVVFVPIDFERQRPRDALVAGGLDPGARAFVSWLGVTVYLTRDAIRRTLASLAALAPGSEAVFSYVTPSSSLDGPARARRAALAARTAAVAEPWLTSFEPDELARELRELGFVPVEDLGPEDAFGRYFQGRSDGLRPGDGVRLARAKVAGRATSFSTGSPAR